MIWLVVFKRVAVDHETSGINEIRNLNDGRVAETRSGPAGGGRAASSGRWWLISGSREGGRERERVESKRMLRHKCFMAAFAHVRSPGAKVSHNLAPALVKLGLSPPFSPSLNSVATKCGKRLPTVK